MHLIGLQTNQHDYRDLKKIIHQTEEFELDVLSENELFATLKQEDASFIFIPLDKADFEFKERIRKIKGIAAKAIIIAIVEEDDAVIKVLDLCIQSGADDVIDPKTTTPLALHKVVLFNKKKQEKENELLKAQKEILWNTKRVALMNEIQNYHSKGEQDFLDFSLNKAIELTASQFGYIYFYDEEKKLFTLNSWSNDVMDNCNIVEPNTCYELDKTGYWGEAVRQRRPLILNDFNAHNPLKKGYPAGHAVLHRFMTTPIYNDDKIIAVVGMANKVEPYTDDDVQQLQFMMNTVWNTIYNRKLELENLEIANALENSPVSIVITDINGNIELVNKYFEKRTGYSFSEVKGKNPRVLKSGAQSQEFYQNLWLTIKSGKTWTGELQNRAKDGSIFWESSTISPIKNPNGVITRFIAVKKDITEKRMQEKELIRQKRLLETVESLSKSGGWEYDASTNKLVWTKAMYDLHGFDHTDKTIDLIAESSQCYHESDYEEMTKLLAEAIKLGTGYERTFQFTNLKGDKLWVRHKCKTVKNQNGEFSAAYGSIRDVTNEINSKLELENYAAKLKESEQIKSSVIDVLAEGLVVQDQSDKIVLANDAACETLSLSMEQLTGKSSFDPLWKATDENNEVLKPEMHPSNVTLRTGEVVKDFIMKVNTGDHKRRIIRINSNPVFNEKGEVLQAVTSFVDITEAQLAHERLLNAEISLDYALKATDAGTWDWNIKTGAIDINHRWATLIGYTQQELEPVSIKLWEHLSHPEDVKKALEMLKQNLNGELDYYDCQVRMKHKLGHWVWIWTRGRVFSRDNKNEALRMVGTHIDISDWKKAEYDLKESEEKYRFLNESIEEIIWSADSQGNIDYINSYGLNQVGKPLDHLVQFGWLSIIHPDDKNSVLAKWTQCISSGTNYFNEQRFRMKDGSYHWFKVSASARKDTEGKIIKWVGLCVDINAEKEAAEIIRKNSNNLELLAKYVNDFIHFTDKQSIYSYLANQVHNMIGQDSMVFLSELVESGTSFEIKKVAGLSKIEEQVLSFIGQPIEGLSGKLNPKIYLTLNADSLTDLPLSISEISDGTFASMINDSVFKLLGISAIKSILLKTEEQEIAVLSVICKKDNVEINADLLKAFLKQASLALLRAKTVDDIVTSERALKEAQSIAKLGSFTYHMDSGQYELSDEAQNILGTKGKAILSEAEMHNSIHPEDKPSVKNYYKSLISGKQSEFDYRVIVDDKSKWLKQIIRPTKGLNNQVFTVESTILDITKQKEVEQKLEQNKTRFKNLIENNSDLIILENPDFNIIYVSPSVKQMLGYSPEEVLHQNGRLFIHPDDRANRDAIIAPLIQGTTKIASVKQRLKKKNKDYIWTETVFTNQLGVTGVDAFVLNIRDIDDAEKYANELRAVNERFKLAASATKSIIWDLDVEKQEYFINDSFQSLFGYTDQYISVEKWNELIHEEDRLRVKKSFDQMVASVDQAFWLIDYRFKKLDGSYAWTSNKSTIIRNDQGEVVRVIGTINDITERVQYEQFIQKQNEQLKDIAWMQSHLVRSPLTNLLALLELLKDSNSEEREVMESMLFESANKLDTVIKNIVKNAERLGKTPRSIEEEAEIKSELSVADIHLHPALLEMAPKAYFVCNKKKQITFINRAFTELSGYSFNDLHLQNEIEQLFDIEENGSAIAYMFNKESDREPYEIELKLKPKVKGAFWVRLNAQPFISEEGVFQGFFFTVKDIEYEKNIEKSILEKSETLSHINDELKHFTYTISHDLKEPVNSLSGILSLLNLDAKEHFSEEEQEYMHLATQSVERISSMVKSLLEYSKFGADNEQAKTISITSVLDEIKLALKVQIEKNNAQIIFHGDDQLINVHPVQFSRVMQNLINNSIKFRAKADPIIHVYLKDIDSHWEISVADNGKGIKQEDVKHVFDLFYFKNKNKNESHGIGLAVVKKLIEKHDGEIIVKSTEGKGTTFTFTISKSILSQTQTPQNQV